MMEKVRAAGVGPTGDDPPQTLMESGSVELTPARDTPIAVCRGMTVLTSKGFTVGHVAAVVLDSRSGKVTHLVLSRLIQTLEYRLTPINLIESVTGDAVRLRICHPVEESLPIWHSV